jgi:hypothetical protein
MNKNVLRIVLVAILALSLSSSTSAFADTDNEDFFPNDLNADIVSQLSVDAINNDFMEELPYKLTVDDVDLSKAYKIYVDTNIFAIETNDFESLRETLDNESVFIFEVPIFLSNGDTYVANLQRNLPLSSTASEVMTDNEITDYEANVGNWVVSVTSQYLAGDSQYIDRYSIIEQESDNEGTMPIFVGGLPYFRHAVAITPDESGNIDKLIVLNPGIVLWQDLGKDEGTSFNYSEIKDYINSHPEVIDPELTGGFGGVAQDVDSSGTGLTARSLIAIVVIVIAVTSFIFAMRRYRRVS